MVKLAETDILTKEVLDWKGLHLFHFMGSSCSQKTRISFGMKGVEWESHHVDIGKFENFTEWFMGINPRGLMPTLVHDGDVHIESNDIIKYVDETFDGPRLYPTDPEEQAFMEESMKLEDDLHLCVRALTFRYLMPVEMMKKSDDAVDVMEAEGAETVGGKIDGRKAIEVKFWRDMNANNGITDAQIIEAVSEFKPVFRRSRRTSGSARVSAGQRLLRAGHRLVDHGLPGHQAGLPDRPLPESERLVREAARPRRVRSARSPRRPRCWKSPRPTRPPAPPKARACRT